MVEEIDQADSNAMAEVKEKKSDAMPPLMAITTPHGDFVSSFELATEMASLIVRRFNELEHKHIVRFAVCVQSWGTRGDGTAVALMEFIRDRLKENNMVSGSQSAYLEIYCHKDSGRYIEVVFSQVSYEKVEPWYSHVVPDVILLWNMNPAMTLFKNTLIAMYARCQGLKIQPPHFIYCDRGQPGNFRHGWLSVIIGIDAAWKAFKPDKSTSA